MARAVYIVLESMGKWWVDHEGRSFGPFSSRNTATMEAISLARFISHTGRVSEVRVPGEGGRYPVEWESEPDRFRRPPPPLPPRRGLGAASSHRADGAAGDGLDDEDEDGVAAGTASPAAPVSHAGMMQPS